MERLQRCHCDSTRSKVTNRKEGRIESDAKKTRGWKRESVSRGYFERGGAERFPGLPLRVAQSLLAGHPAPALRSLLHPVWMSPGCLQEEHA